MERGRGKRRAGSLSGRGANNVVNFLPLTTGRYCSVQATRGQDQRAINLRSFHLTGIATNAILKRKTNRKKQTLGPKE
jgi:hypothetical protein